MADSPEDLQKQMDTLIEELAAKVQEWVHLTDHGNRASILTSGVILFESSLFDDDGVQMYRQDYLPLPPTSSTQLVGLINTARDDLRHRMFGHCGGHE